MSDRRLYALSGLLVASGLVHLVVWLVLGGAWSGPVSGRKPFTFGLAFGVILATITWVTRYLTSRFRAGWLAAFRPNPALAPSMRLAVRAGFVSFAAALLIGAAMIAIGVVRSRTVSLAAAYAATGNLTSGHAATMHGMLVLPVLAWLAARTGWSESRRVRVVALGCAGYLVAAGAVVVETAVGVDVVASPGRVPVISSPAPPGCPPPPPWWPRTAARRRVRGRRRPAAR